MMYTSPAPVLQPFPTPFGAGALLSMASLLHKTISLLSPCACSLVPPPVKPQWMPCYMPFTPARLPLERLTEPGGHRACACSCSRRSC